MKNKIIKILIIIVVVVAIGSLIIASIFLNRKQNDLDKHLVELNFSELQEKIDNKETFLLVITQTTCSHCAEYKPVLKETLAEYDLVGYYIEEDLLSKEDLGKLKEIANVSGTPTTIFIENGQEGSTSTRLSGNQQKSVIVQRLKSMGYINE